MCLMSPDRAQAKLLIGVYGTPGTHRAQNPRGITTDYSPWHGSRRAPGTRTKLNR